MAKPKAPLHDRDEKRDQNGAAELPWVAWFRAFLSRIEGADEPTKNAVAREALTEFEAVAAGGHEAVEAFGGVSAIAAVEIVRRACGPAAFAEGTLDWHLARPLRSQLIDLTTLYIDHAITTQDPATISVARILDAMTVALRRGDVKKLREWETRVDRYVIGRADSERNHPAELPPRASKGRARAVRALVAAATRLSRNPALTPAQIGRELRDTMERHFPHLNRHPLGFYLRRPEMISAGIAQAVEEDRSMFAGRLLPRKFAAAALREHGVTGDEIKAWLKPSDSEE